MLALRRKHMLALRRKHMLEHICNRVFGMTLGDYYCFPNSTEPNMGTPFSGHTFHVNETILHLEKFFLTNDKPIFMMTNSS